MKLTQIRPSFPSLPLSYHEDLCEAGEAGQQATNVSVLCARDILIQLCHGNVMGERRIVGEKG